MDPPPAKTKGRRRTKKQEDAAAAVTAFAGGAATVAANAAAAAAPAATQATGATEPTEQEVAMPKPSISQRLVKSLKQLSQLGAGSKAEEGDEVEQQVLEQEEQEQEAAPHQRGALAAKLRRQVEWHHTSSTDGREGEGDGEGHGEEEGGGQGGGLARRAAARVRRLGRRLAAASVPHAAASLRLPANMPWPAASAAAAAALVLLVLVGGLLTVHQLGASSRQLAELDRKLSTQAQVAAAVREQLGGQLTQLHAMLASLERRMADSCAELAGVQRSISTHEGAAEGLRAELSRLDGDMAQLRLAVAAAAAAAAPAQLHNASASAAAASRNDEASSYSGETAAAALATALAAGSGQHILRQTVHDEVTAALELFAADRTGLPDYALAAVGAAVVAHSPTHQPPGGAAATATARLGLPLHRLSNPAGVHPQANKLLLSPISQPGTCLPLVGSSGWVDIRLAQTIHPTAFTYEHIPASVAFDIRSAPRNITLTGFKGRPPPPPAPTGPLPAASSAPAPHEHAEAAATTGAASGSVVPLGAFAYDARSGPAVQTFQLAGAPPGLLVDHVRLSITANHGHPGYTCLYRIRVHGSLPSPATAAAGQGTAAAQPA